MALSHDLLSQFAKIVNTKDKTNTATTIYGKVVTDENGDTYVQPDGSDQYIPLDDTSTEANPGDRVSVQLKDHTATVTGNLTSPAASTTTVKDMGIVLADRIQANEAYIGRLDADKINVGQLDAAKAEIAELYADKATIEQLNVKVAEINDLTVKKLDAEIADLKYATIENLEVTTAKVGTLEAAHATFQNATVEDLKAQNAEIENLKAKDAEIQNLVVTDLTAANAEIENLKAKDAEIQNLVATNFEATNATIENLDTKYADIKFANIDFADIDIGVIKDLFAKSGVIDDLIVSEGKITGELVGVTIKGNLIEAGTLKADQIVVLGSDGNYYKLNTDLSNMKDENGEPIKPVDTEAIHGSVLVEKSIVAEKIAVDDLVAFGATIGRFKIEDDSIHSVSKTAVNSPLEGIYMDSEGQVAFGNDTNFVKFFKDEDGKFKLIVSADQMKFSTGKSVEDTIDYAITEKGRNWLLDTKATRSLYRVGDNAFPNLEYEFSKDLLKSDSREFTISYDAMMVDDEETADIRLQFFFLIDGVVYEADSSALTTAQTRYTSHKTLPDDYTCADITAAKFRLTKGSGTAVFTNVKLESGSEASDWTPAPEDTDENITKLEETLRQEIIEQSAEIVETSRGITMTALEDYVSSDEYEEYKAARQAEFEVLSEGISGRVTAVESRTDKLNEDLQNKLNAITKYFTFDINGLQIGAIESEPRPVIFNKETGEYVEDEGSEDEGSEENEQPAVNRNWLLSSQAQRSLNRTSGYPNIEYGFSQDLLKSDSRTFTVSYDAFMAAEATGIKLQFFFNVNNGTTSTVVAASSSALTISKTRYVSHVTLPDAYTCADITNTKFRLTAGTGICYFENVKLESGDTATEWSPAPEEEPTPDPSPDEPGNFSPTGGTPVEDAYTTDGRQVYQYTDSDGTVKYYCLSDIGPSPNKVVIDNDEISILVNGIPIQTFKSDGTALIPSLSVTQKMQLLGLQITSDDTHINCDFMGV